MAYGFPRPIATRSPTFKCVTAFPASSTVPAASRPATNGGFTTNHRWRLSCSNNAGLNRIRQILLDLDQHFIASRLLISPASFSHPIFPIPSSLGDLHLSFHPSSSCYVIVPSTYRLHAPSTTISATGRIASHAGNRRHSSSGSPILCIGINGIQASFSSCANHRTSALQYTQLKLLNADPILHPLYRQRARHMDDTRFASVVGGLPLRDIDD